jgi:hypothetical protein
MAADKTLTTKPSSPEEVDAYMRRLKHPLVKVVEELRQIILKTNSAIGEEIKWNAPTFFYTGKLQQSDPKEYRRYLVIFNLFKKDCLRLVFWNGAAADDKSGFLLGDYPDGRRLATFCDANDVKSKKRQLQATLKRQLKNIKKMA